LREKLDAILERLNNLPLTYEIANPTEQRLLHKEITSNVTANRKAIEITLKSPFRDLATTAPVSSSALPCDNPRMQAIADALVQYCVAPEMQV
jgi:hypothetical protein